MAFNPKKNLGLLDLLITEINAALTLIALILSIQFGLTSTYFLVTGISGGNLHIVIMALLCSLGLWFNLICNMNLMPARSLQMPLLATILKVYIILIQVI
jgi:purine nucleoside permease